MASSSWGLQAFLSCGCLTPVSASIFTWSFPLCVSVTKNPSFLLHRLTRRIILNKTENSTVAFQTVDMVSPLTHLEFSPVRLAGYVFETGDYCFLSHLKRYLWSAYSYKDTDH